jgi:hypothetical protein
MKTFVEGVIRQAAAQTGIEKVVLHTASNLTLPKPRLEFEFLPETYIPTGRKIAKRKADGKQIMVNERYEVDTPAMLYIIDNDDARIEHLSRKLVLSFPRGVADTYNNWVRIRAALAEWTGFKAPTVGLDAKRIEPLIERSYSVKVSFLWRLTYEEATPYIEQLDFTGVKYE